MDIKIFVTPHVAATLAISLLVHPLSAQVAFGQSSRIHVQPALQPCARNEGAAIVLSPDFGPAQSANLLCALQEPMLPEPAASSTSPRLEPEFASPDFADEMVEDPGVIEAIIGSVKPLAQHAMEGSLEGVLLPPGTDSAPGPVTVKAQAAQDEITRSVLAWTRAWSARNAEAYLAHYSADFSTGEPGFSLAQWSQQRRQRLARPAWITVKAQDLRVEMTSADSAQVRFQQEYRSPAVNETTRKLLELKRQGDAWRIFSERAE